LNHLLRGGSTSPKWGVNITEISSVRYDSVFGGIKVAPIVDFYRSNKNNYTIIKEEWVLSKNECDYLAKVLDEIKAQSEERNVYSNASEHYAILTKDKCHVFIDRTGSWNKFLKIKKRLNIEQYPRKL